MELLGAVSGAAGLASLVIQLSSGVVKLRALYNQSKKLPAHIQTITDDLEFIAQFLPVLEEIVADGMQESPIVVGRCMGSAEAVAGALECLLDKLPQTLQASSSRARIKLVMSSKTMLEDIQELQRLILDAKMNINMEAVPISHYCSELTSYRALAYYQMRFNQRNSRVLSALSQDLSGLSLTASTEQHPREDPEHAPEHAPTQESPPSLRKATLVPYRDRFDTRRSNCSIRKCSCVCHTKGLFGRRFWMFEYTPLSMILGSCSSPRCTARRHGAMFRLALSQLGLPFAALISLDVTVERGKLSLKPSLQLERIVRFTSPGFKALFEWRNYIIGLEECKDSLIKLYREDPQMINHVNPKGVGYLEELLCHPSPGIIHDFVEILHLFVKDFNMTLGLDRIALLYSCASWIGEAPHLYLLEELLDVGFDPLLLENPQPRHWPDPCDPNWMSEPATPDPFFIEFLSMIVKCDAEFGNTTQLQHAILQGNLKAVSSLINTRGFVENERNFLGQTALHLAVCDENITRILLDAGHDPNATDNNGITPLMYAAAMGQLPVGILLITYGTKIGTKDELRERDFMGFAFARGRWGFFLGILDHLRALDPWVSEHVVPWYVKRGLISLARDKWIPAGQGIAILTKSLSFLDDINFSFQDNTEETTGNSLLHLRWDLNEAKAIAEHGFTGFNQQNSLGKTPLMIHAALGSDETVQLLLENRARPNDQDSLGYSSLTYGLEKWQLYGAPHYTVDTARQTKIIESLIKAGASTNIRDNCRCPCSPDGCMPTMCLSTHFWQGAELLSSKLSLSVEWLILLKDLGKTDCAKASLLSFIRRGRFDELSLQHVCCQSGTSSISGWASVLNSKSVPQEEKETALLRQRESIEMLDVEMRELETLSLSDLENAWLNQLRRCHDKYLELHQRPKWNQLLLQKSQRPKASFDKMSYRDYKVNFREDSFQLSAKHSPLTLGRSLSPLSDIASFVEIIEHVLRERSGQDAHEEVMVWYNSRLEWVHRIMESMDITVEYIVQELQEAHLGKGAGDGMIEHFVKACSARRARTESVDLRSSE